jgi:hypothetical protein
MTAKEIEKRLTALENGAEPETAPHMFLTFRSSSLPPDAWAHPESGNTFWRTPGESDDELMKRVKTASPPQPGTHTKLFQRQLERFSD